MNRKPFASIIVPTYNQAGFLGQALDSLLLQTDADWEAIVVNDGSTDNTAEIAEDYARRDSRIRCIHKLNGGVASALNAGLENARGDWVHWLSSDDMFEPRKLEINRRWIERYPDTVFFFSYFTLLREATGKLERRELWGPLPDPEFQILTLFYRNYISGITICVRRSTWESVGFFDESLHYAQDYDQWLRLLKVKQAKFIPEWTVISRNHAAQDSETFPDACYFDTAKAALRFINRHSFPELVPCVDLSDESSASRAVSYALDVAFDRTALLYCLGVQSALVHRVLEWIFTEKCAHFELKALVRNRIAEMSFVEGDDGWAWMWRQLALAVHGGLDFFPYVAIDPTQVALCEHQVRRMQGNPAHEPLRNYLNRFEGVDVRTAPELETQAPRIALLIDQTANTDDLLNLADRLARRGLRPLLLIKVAQAKEPALQTHGWVPIIRVTSFDQNTLPWLGEIELAISFSGNMSTSPVWISAISHMNLTVDARTQDIAELEILNKLGRGLQGPVRPVVFLERVLWGGGAERVVFDIVRHMDRLRYRPVILTLFDEHTKAPKLPQGVECRNVRREFFE